MYRTGFIGASTAEATAWVGESVKDAKTILVPFAGSGRDIASMVGEGRTIESWDTQFYSKAVVEGVFAATEVDTAIDGIHYRKGLWYEKKPLRNIDDRCAGFIDYVSKHGTLYDKACLASAIVRSTLMGRMTQWYANIELLWKRFNTARRHNSEWINQPGTFIHHEGSFFDEVPDKHYDLIQVDPPKIVVGSDVYSKNFDALNTVLGGAAPLPKWNWREVMSKFEQIMKIDADRVLFMYVTGVKPDIADVKKMLTSYGDIEEERVFVHRGRNDIGIIIRKG